MAAQVCPRRADVARANAGPSTKRSAHWLHAAPRQQGLASLNRKSLATRMPTLQHCETGIRKTVAPFRGHDRAKHCMALLGFCLAHAHRCPTLRKTIAVLSMNKFRWVFLEHGIRTKPEKLCCLVCGSKKKTQPQRRTIVQGRQQERRCSRLHGR